LESNFTLSPNLASENVFIISELGLSIKQFNWSIFDLRGQSYTNIVITIHEDNISIELNSPSNEVYFANGTDENSQLHNSEINSKEVIFYELKCSSSHIQLSQNWIRHSFEVVLDRIGYLAE